MKLSGEDGSFSRRPVGATSRRKCRGASSPDRRLSALAWFARCSRHLAGAWRWIYVVTAMVALYLNVFVAIVQSFLKIPALHVLAPTQTEPPFQVTQLVALVLFVVLTIAAVVRFHPDAGSAEVRV